MTVHPFTEAEKRDGHNVKRVNCCRSPVPPSMPAVSAHPAPGRSVTLS